MNGSEDPNATTGSGDDGPPPTVMPGDAAAAEARFAGSPLCRITGATCNPDDDGTRPSPYVLACAVASDGGTSARGCRIDGSSGEPVCAAAASGRDGAHCKSGSECAAGFDCVVEGKALTGGEDDGVCRRYCCAGSCDDMATANGGAAFCDVQKLASGAQVVPVCMPIKACKPFTAGECGSDETCGVVTDDGATGCVTNGSAKVGGSCDEEHCGAGLTCLGQPGSRKCYQLCRMESGCKSPNVCKTSTLFADPSVGVCDAP